MLLSMWLKWHIKICGPHNCLCFRMLAFRKISICYEIDLPLCSWHLDPKASASAAGSRVFSPGQRGETSKKRQVASFPSHLLGGDTDANIGCLSRCRMLELRPLLYAKNTTPTYSMVAKMINISNNTTTYQSNTMYIMYYIYIYVCR